MQDSLRVPQRAVHELFYDMQTLQFCLEKYTDEQCLKLERMKFEALLFLLEHVLPTDYYDIIIFFTALAHACYLLSMPTSKRDPWIDDGNLTNPRQQAFYAGAAEGAIAEAAAISNAFWIWLRQMHGIRGLPTPLRCRQMQQDFRWQV